MMKVYCIIVTYNGHRWVDKCFGSLRNSRYPITTIVVDNCSNDLTIPTLRKSYPGVHIIENNSNLGFGVANNVGIGYAMDQGADFIFLLNQDAWIEPQAVESLVEVAKSNPAFGILSPVHLSGDEKSLDQQFSIYVSPPKTTFLTDSYAQQLKPFYNTDFINAAAWFMPRACIETVGLFEPMFFLYGEDYNYAERMKYHALKFGLVSAARIVHDRAEREGKKSKKGIEIEVLTFLYVKLFNINKSVWYNFIQSLKVFVRFGFHVSTVYEFIAANARVIEIRRRINMHKRLGYLVHSRSQDK